MKIKTKTIENDEEYLRQISSVVEKNDKDLNKEIQLLKEYCKQTPCLAFAAIQIGIPKRIIYLKNTNLNSINDKEHDEAKILINPVILERNGHTEFWENCLSCLDNMGLVSRPYEITLRYEDENRKLHTESFSGFKATVLSHELDHLDGILHIDIADEIINMPKEERKIFRLEHPYRIISQTCDYDKEVVKHYFEAKYKKARVNSLKREYNVIIDEYNNKLFDLFKHHIDMAIEDSKKINRNNTKDKNESAIDTYVYVNKKIQNCFTAIANIQGRESDPDLSEDLIERIYTYIEPITLEAKKAIKKEAENVLDSYTLSELHENYNNLKSKLDIIANEVDIDYLFEDIEFLPSEYYKKNLK